MAMSRQRMGRGSPSEDSLGQDRFEARPDLPIGGHGSPLHFPRVSATRCAGESHLRFPKNRWPGRRRTGCQPDAAASSAIRQLVRPPGRRRTHNCRQALATTAPLRWTRICPQALATTARPRWEDEDKLRTLTSGDKSDVGTVLPWHSINPVTTPLCAMARLRSDTNVSLDM